MTMAVSCVTIGCEKSQLLFVFVILSQFDSNFLKIESILSMFQILFSYKFYDSIFIIIDIFNKI